MMLPILAAVAWFSYPPIRDWLWVQSGWVVRVEPGDLDIVVHDGDTIASCAVDVRNISSHTVRIEGASASCTCVRVQSKMPMELPRGGSGSLKITAYKPPGDRTVTPVSLLLFLDTASAPTGVNLTVQRN